jgi:hypothetical protein
MPETDARHECRQALAASERVTDVPAAVPETVRKSFDRLHAATSRRSCATTFYTVQQLAQDPKCGQVLRNCSSHQRLYGGAAQYSRW